MIAIIATASFASSALLVALVVISFDFGGAPGPA
ncbi:hypothetical protein ABIA39_004571 [Nocardia sp. GAS34]